MSRILIIEDDAGGRRAVVPALRVLGHDVIAVEAADATSLLDVEDFDVVVVGVVPRRAPPPTVAAAPALLYLPTPLAPEAVVAALDDLEARGAIRRELADAARAVAEDRRASPIVGRSAAMRPVLERVAAVAASDAPVLLSGETGTGKDLVAQAIHGRSARRDGPFIAVNCAAISETLLEAELFGHEQGAQPRHDGRFVAAAGGTLLLDEINALSIGAQAKLLRVLQDGHFQPVGSNEDLESDVRIICSTNRDLRRLVTEGHFREDLYYRINVVDLEVPPLRARGDDLGLLVHYFLARFAPADRPPPDLSPRAWAALARHRFPGNVRELEHAIQRAIILARGAEIDLEHLPAELCPGMIDGPVTTGDLRPLADAVKDFEREYVLRVLREAGGNKTRAARLLGISRKHLWHKLTRMVSIADHGEEEIDAYEH